MLARGIDVGRNNILVQREASSAKPTSTTTTTSTTTSTHGRNQSSMTKHVGAGHTYCVGCRMRRDPRHTHTRSSDLQVPSRSCRRNVKSYIRALKLTLLPPCVVDRRKQALHSRYRTDPRLLCGETRLIFLGDQPATRWTSGSTSTTLKR